MNVSLNSKVLIKLRKKISFVAFLLFITQILVAQDSNKLYQGYVLNSVLIDDIKNGFDIDKFIQRIQDDSTFYKAFKTMSLMSYTQYNDIRFLDKKGERSSYYNSISEQEYDGRCRIMKTKNIKHDKNYFKNKNEPRFITAQFYHKLFLISKKKCNENNIVNGKLDANENNRINQLKQLVFRPGQPISGVPGIGNKVGIFTDKRKEQYDFSLDKEIYNGEWCYVFRAKSKDAYQKQNVINYLNTWFRVKDYSIVRRNYSLSYSTLVYDFDVEMKVKLKTIDDKLIPYEVYYKGDWHFFGKKRERAEFSSILTDFK